MYNQPHNRHAMIVVFPVSVTPFQTYIQAVFGVSSPKGLKAKPPT